MTRIENRYIKPLHMEFAYLPPGEFTAGSPAEEPYRYQDEVLHRVTISKGLFMQTTPVTQPQWSQLMEDNPSYFRSDTKDCPVEQVSWHDC